MFEYYETQPKKSPTQIKKAMVETRSAYFNTKKKVETGPFVAHRWFEPDIQFLRNPSYFPTNVKPQSSFRYRPVEGHQNISL